jgi:hypothetical protein
VYAACGGTISAVKDQHGGGGRYCNLSTWLHDSVSMMQFLHNEEVLVGKGAIVKAGDVIALMGRTGNPDKHSPTHMHFQCFHRGKLELIDPVVPQHEVVFPHNRLPKLIPCAADWGAGNSKATSNDDKAHGARHCAKRYSENSGNTTWKRCWAFEMGKCPYANGVIGVEAEEAPCPCEPPTENYPYADETFTVIEQMRQPIIDWAMRYNVRPLVVAGSIADEYNSRLTTMGGYKGTIDDIQDWLIQKSGQTVMDLSDEYLDSKAGRMTRWDIGKGNINVRTAWEMYQRYRGDFPSGDWTIHDVARYVLTDNGTAHVAACYIKYAEERIGDATASCDVKTTEAVQVTYYKQGPNYLRRYEQSCATVERDRAENPALPRHQIRPGEGCRVCRQRDRLLKALWGNFPPRQ